MECMSHQHDHITMLTGLGLTKFVCFGHKTINVVSLILHRLTYLFLLVVVVAVVVADNI